MGRLKDKVAVVTGVGAGIGQGIALMFAREGAKAFGSDINEKAAETTSKSTAVLSLIFHRQTVDRF